MNTAPPSNAPSLQVRIASLGGVIGPVAFIGAWGFGAAKAGSGYSSVEDAISQLAAVGANTRPLMTAGFAIFGFALPVYASSLRRVLGGPGWITAGATGVATLAVALTPLGRSATTDTLHAVFAGIGYATLAATPLLAARPLFRQGHRTLAGAGVVAGVASAVALVLSTTALPTGVFQRVGLTVTDAWIIASAAMIAGDRLTRR